MTDLRHGVAAKLDVNREGGCSKPYMEFSALHGFPLAQLDDIKKASNKMGVVHALRNPPRNERGWVYAFLKFLFAEISEERLAEIWSLRKSAQKAESAANAGNLLSEHIDILQGAVAEDELDEIMSTIKKSREHSAKLRCAMRPSRAGIKTFREEDISVDDVQELCPPDWVMRKDTVLHHRWKCELRGGKGMATKVYVGRDNYTEKMALREVLRKAWAIFERSDVGYACPHDIEEI